MHTIPKHTRTTSPTQPSRIVATQQQITSSRIRPVRVLRCSVRYSVVQAGIAIAAEEENVFARSGLDERRRFGDARVGKALVVEECDGRALQRDAVCGDGLQHDGRGDDGRDGVAADAAVAEGVAVDLEGLQEWLVAVSIYRAVAPGLDKVMLDPVEHSVAVQP